MTEFDPYTPPAAELSSFEESNLNELELADRGTRLGASLLDGLILAIPVLLPLWLFYSAFGHKFWIPVPGVRGVLLSLGAISIGALVDLAVNGRLLIRHGQTIGKKICHIKIVKTTGEVPSLFDSYVKRRVVFSVLQQVPFAGGLFSLVDALMIFRDNRRCLHDQIAGTIVVKA